MSVGDSSSPISTNAIRAGATTEFESALESDPIIRVACDRERFGRHQPCVSARIATPFFEVYIAQCDTPDAFTVIARNARITTIEATPDAPIEIWADVMCYSHPETAPAGTDALVIASAERIARMIAKDAKMATRAWRD